MVAKQLVANFDSKCATCQLEIQSGTTIWYEAGVGSWHLTCPHPKTREPVRTWKDVPAPAARVPPLETAASLAAAAVGSGSAKPGFDLVETWIKIEEGRELNGKTTTLGLSGLFRGDAPPIEEIVREGRARLRKLLEEP